MNTSFINVGVYRVSQWMDKKFTRSQRKAILSIGVFVLVIIGTVLVYSSIPGVAYADGGLSIKVLAQKLKDNIGAGIKLGAAIGVFLGVYRGVVGIIGERTDEAIRGFFIAGASVALYIMSDWLAGLITGGSGSSS